MVTPTSDRRTVNAKQGCLLIAVVLAAVIGVGFAVAPDSSSHSTATESSSHSAKVVQPHNDDEEVRLRVAISMVDEDKLDLEGIKKVKAKLEGDLDRSDGKQLTTYAGFLWAASEAAGRRMDLETRGRYQTEGLDTLSRAKSLGWTKAYLIDGSWRGQISSIDTSIFLGSSDPRGATWPIIVAVEAWADGASKGDPECRFVLDHIAPSWETGQTGLREIKQLQGALEAKKRSGAPADNLQVDLAVLDERKTSWIAASGMVQMHLVDHQHDMPCWNWVSVKSGKLMAQWDQEHPVH